MQRRGRAGLEVLRDLRPQARVGRAAAAFVLAAATTALLTPPLADVARVKPFWLDEGFEIAEACRHSYLSLVVRGAPGQCSPSPLYYLAQRLSVRSLERFDERIAVSYRRVSLVAAGLLLFMTTLVLQTRLGAAWALVAAATLASQPLFVHYAAENRPYLSWLLLFALTVLAAAEAASRPWREVGRARRMALAVAAIALALVALPGALQAGLASALCGLSWRRASADRREARAALAWSLLLAAGCTALGLYFGARSPCRAYDAGHLALRFPDRAGLVRPILSLIWSDGVAGHVGNVLLLLGLVPAFRLGPDLASRAGDAARRTQFAAWLSRGVGAQVVLTVLLAVQVFQLGYYFIPRVFLHLAVCRALLVALGGWSLMRWLTGRGPAPARTALQTLAVGLAVLAVASSFSLERQDVEERRLAWAAGTAPCVFAPGTLVVDVPAGMTDWALGPNFIVRLAEERRRCSAGASSDERHVLVGRGDYQFSADRAPGAVPLEQCGRSVVLSWGVLAAHPPDPPLAPRK
ncbi:MAG TPA: hypothetical protein VGN09_13660 [Vicinamibacteria bacterium]